MRTVERLAYFDMYVADYLLDTVDLSLAEHGAYCLLMFRYYWQGELRRAEVYKHCRTDEERVAVDRVLEKYFHDEGELLKHNRIERELEALSQYISHQSKAGKASAEARARKRRGNGAQPPLKENGPALPDWLDAATFAAWIKIRPAKARTQDAQRAAIAKLERFRAAGHDPNAIVAESLANGWQGIFPPDRKGGSGPTLAERNKAAAEEFLRRREQADGQG